MRCTTMARLAALLLPTVLAACGGAQSPATPTTFPELVEGTPYDVLHTAPETLAADTDLRIAAWNIRCLLDGDGEVAFCNTNRYTDETYPRTEADYARLRAHAEAMALDVVFLQEIENDAALERVFPGWSITTFGTSVQRVGIAVAPHSPASVVDVEPLTSLVVTERSRPGLLATLRWNGQDVRALNLHLKSGCFDNPLGDPDDDACPTQLRQLEALEAWLAAQPTPVLLLGDFNRRMEGEEGFEERMQAAAGAPLVRLTEDRTSACWEHLADRDYAPIYPEYIDHIVFSPTLLDAWGPATFEQYVYDDDFEVPWWTVSDHCPVIVEFGDAAP